jgi:hypothetical protein
VRRQGRRFAAPRRLQAFYQAFPNLVAFSPSLSKDSFGGFVGFQGVIVAPNLNSPFSQIFWPPQPPPAWRPSQLGASSGRSEFATPNADAINGASTVTSAAPTVMAGLVRPSARFNVSQDRLLSARISMGMLSPHPTQTVGRFRLRRENFACETLNFACETILFRQAPSQDIEIVGARNLRFRGFVRFEGFTTHFFRAFFGVHFPIRPPWLA